MNEFLDQFLLESRELVEQASADLLVLERNPLDKATLDSAFRAFHTLKGGAGIVDFFAMAEVVHRAEDLLAGVRSKDLSLTSAVVSECLATLDQVGTWLNEIEATGELPGDAVIAAEPAQGDTKVAEGETAVTVARPTAAEGWATALAGRHPGVGASALNAILYTPAADCFFEHEDPFDLVARLHGLLAIEVEPVVPWPPAGEIQPYDCNVAILALTRDSPAAISAALGSAFQRCVVVPVSGVDAGRSQDLPHDAKRLVEAQLDLLRDPPVQGRLGRLGSAGNVVRNVLRSVGRASEADVVEAAARAARAANDPARLTAAIAAILDGVSAPEPAVPTVVDSVAPRTLRVDAARVDTLVDLTGELIVVKNSIAHLAVQAQAGDSNVASRIRDIHTSLDRLMAKLQRSVLEMRVLPLQQVFQRFPRLLRDLGVAAKKPVQLVIEGGDTEADKVVVEALFEPLLHVMRNAVDHGVEDTPTRRARGKSELATVTIKAWRDADHVVVEVRDDGGGIDVSRVKEVALKNNLVDEDALEALPDERVIDMIFEPGFSTARSVSGVSGRGVGMDAVRAATRRLGGTVRIDSLPGQGATVRFQLPFSVMMTTVMVVTAGGQAFGIPLDTVEETFRAEAGRIVPIAQGRAIALRGQTVPLISLAEELGLKGLDPERPESIVVVVHGHLGRGGLLVEDVGESMEVMLKPLEGLLAGMRGIAGSTLLGDGSVLLVLDPAEILS